MPSAQTIAQAVETAWVATFGQTSFDENRPFDEVGQDSLEVLSMLVDLEQALDIEIPDNIVAPEMNPQDLIAAISRLAGVPATVHDDRPLVFLFAGSMSANQIGALKNALILSFRLVPINANDAKCGPVEQMRQSAPTGAINVIAATDAAAVATDAAAKLTGMGYRPGFTFVVDRNAQDDMPSVRAAIIEAFVASQRVSA